jgi:aldose 1-epimerase
MSDSVTEQIILRDEASGSQAAILPAFGFNCFRFTAVVDGAPVEALWAEPDFGPGSRPTRNGIPILFPFAGRLQGQTFSFNGREYRITDALINDGNAIHGFVLNRPWRVIEQTNSRAVGQFRASRDDPALLDQWPADFEMTVAYEVAGTALLSDITITNPDQERPLPFAFGTHPYFRVPLGDGAPDACRITVPASTVRVQQQHLPTGQRQPVSGSRDLRNGAPFDHLELDDILTDLQASDGQVQTVIADPVSGRRLVQTFDATFRDCIVFTPPHREAIAIEPYTCVPNPFALEAAGVDTGLRTLAPGEEFTARIEIRVE